MVDTITIHIRKGEETPKIKTLGDLATYFLKQLDNKENKINK